MHHTGMFAAKAGHVFSLLPGREGGITGCAQVWLCSVAPRVGGSRVLYRPRSDVPSSSRPEVELGFGCSSRFSCMIHPLSSCYL